MCVCCCVLVLCVLVCCLLCAHSDTQRTLVLCSVCAACVCAVFVCALCVRVLCVLVCCVLRPLRQTFRQHSTRNVDSAARPASLCVCSQMCINCTVVSQARPHKSVNNTQLVPHGGRSSVNPDRFANAGYERAAGRVSANDGAGGRWPTNPAPPPCCTVLDAAVRPLTTYR